MSISCLWLNKGGEYIRVFDAALETDHALILLFSEYIYHFSSFKAVEPFFYYFAFEARFNLPSTLYWTILTTS